MIDPVAVVQRSDVAANRCAHDVLFVHIQKTGGISLFNALARCFAPGESFRFERSSDSEKARLRAMSEAELARHRLISGHFNLPFWLACGLGNRVTISVLRDPVERVLSTFRYMRSWTGHRRHAMARSMSDAELLDDHVADASRHNVQCRRLCGEGDFDAAMSMARRHIDMLGTIESVDLMAGALGRRLGVVLDVGRENRSGVERPRREDLDASQLARLVACNAHDQRLWSEVRRHGVLMGHA